MINELSLINKKPKKIAIVILNYNGWADTIECLESVFRNDYLNCQIIVVDNNSSDNSIDHIKAWADGKLDVFVNPSKPLKYLSFPPIEKPITYSYFFHTGNEFKDIDNQDCEQLMACGVQESHTANFPLILIKSSDNKGFSAGNNIAIKYILGKEDIDDVILLNNDTVIKKDALNNLMNFKNNTGDQYIYGGRIYYYDKPDKIWFDGGKFNPWLGKSIHINKDKSLDEAPCDNKAKLNNFISFCYVLLPVNIIKNVGLLSEEYFMYTDDLDYSFRVIAKGYGICQLCNSEIFHKVSGSNVEKVSPLTVYWNFRNNIWFIRKFLSLRYKITSISYIIATRIVWFTIWLFQGKKYIIINQIKGLIDGFKKRFK